MTNILGLWSVRILSPGIKDNPGDSQIPKVCCFAGPSPLVTRSPLRLYTQHYTLNLCSHTLRHANIQPEIQTHVGVHASPCRNYNALPSISRIRVPTYVTVHRPALADDTQ